MSDMELKLREEMYNPYKLLTREEVMEQLAIARKNADEDRCTVYHENFIKICAVVSAKFN